MIDRMLVTRQGAMARVILAIALFVLGPTAWGNGEVRELTLGVLSYQEPGDVRLRWQPLADYLSERVPGIRVRVRPLMRHDAEPGLARGELQLLLINPYDYAWLEASHGVTRIATLRPRGSGDTPPMFGAVVFQRADARAASSSSISIRTPRRWKGSRRCATSASPPSPRMPSPH